ncbi:MAG: glutamate dehydrogenase, partial [Bacteroidia bacterium]|nr:glutamate dehydrogenase [Bacteroidia bacterium]
GSISAKLLEQQGMKIVAISDISGAYYNKNGIHVQNAIKYASENRGTLEGFTGGEKITNAELLTLDVDVLVPAAMENQITAANANDIKAKLIVEGANGPTSADADEILNRKNIMIVPDILANAGGVTVSYFEWVQNRRGHYYSEAEVNERATTILKNAFEDVHSCASNYNIPMRLAAYVVSVDRVAKVLRMRGKY